jgi:hypothetical protein
MKAINISVKLKNVPLHPEHLMKLLDKEFNQILIKIKEIQFNFDLNLQEQIKKFLV